MLVFRGQIVCMLFSPEYLSARSWSKRLVNRQLMQEPLVQTDLRESFKRICSIHQLYLEFSLLHKSRRVRVMHRLSVFVYRGKTLIDLKS